MHNNKLQRLYSIHWKRVAAIVAIAIVLCIFCRVAFIHIHSFSLDIDPDLYAKCKEIGFNYKLHYAKALARDEESIYELLILQANLDTSPAIENHNNIMHLCDTLGESVIINVVNRLPNDSIRPLRRLYADPEELLRYPDYFHAIGYAK